MPVYDEDRRERLREALKMNATERYKTMQEAMPITTRSPYELSNMSTLAKSREGDIASQVEMGYSPPDGSTRMSPKTLAKFEIQEKANLRNALIEDAKIRAGLAQTGMGGATETLKTGLGEETKRFGDVLRNEEEQRRLGIAERGMGIEERGMVLKERLGRQSILESERAAQMAQQSPRIGGMPAPATTGDTGGEFAMKAYLQALQNPLTATEPEKSAQGAASFYESIRGGTNAPVSGLKAVAQTPEFATKQGIKIPPGMLASQAVEYLTKEHGMSREDAIKYLRGE